MHLSGGVPADVGSRRDSGLTALILGFFAIGWFSWGDAAASGVLSVALTAGSGAALVVTVLGALVMCRSPRTSGATHDGAVRRRYGIVVGTEFALAALGAGALNAIGISAYIPAWICAVVGLHFFALAPVLAAPALRWLGVAVTTAAAAALLIGVSTEIAPSSVAGSGAGLALLTYAILMLRGPRQLTSVSRASYRAGSG